MVSGWYLDNQANDYTSAFARRSHDDAAYLELALRLQYPIATQDTALKEAAMASGVGWVAGG